MDKLTPVQKRLITERIRALDPMGEIVSLSPNETYTGGSIAYNLDSGIVLNEKINRLNDFLFPNFRKRCILQPQMNNADMPRPLGIIHSEINSILYNIV
jgi:hypothetical protein